jgi:hypothetical protein
MVANVRAYASQLQGLDAKDLRSLTLIGEVLRETFDAKRASAKSVVVLERMDLGLLRRIAERGTALGKMGFAAPLVMTQLHIESSLDTFPIEFIEIQQLHATVLGDDPFAGLVFEPGHVRLECERELKRFLIGLRQGLLASAGRTAALGELQHDAACGLLRTLRGMLWLKGKKAYEPDDRVVAGIEELVKRPLRGLRSALNAPAAQPSIDDLYADVEALKVAVDGW